MPISIGSTNNLISREELSNLSSNNNINKDTFNTFNSFSESVSQVNRSIPKSFLNSIRSIQEFGLSGIIRQDVIESNDINTTIINNNQEDLEFTNQNIPNNFLKENLSSIMTNSDESFRNTEFPSVLSHELIKVKSLFNLESNESSLRSNLIYDLKKNYVENIHNSNANSFYLNSKNQDILREVYVEDLKENNELIKRTYSNIELILKEKNKLKIKHNFGNKIANFYLDDSQSSSFGKLGNAIFNFNIAYNHEFTHQNNLLLNNNISNLFINRRNEEFSRFKEKLNKILDLMISRHNCEESFLKNINSNNFLLNSDRIISQIILNTSVSLNGFYKDSLSYDYWSKKISSASNNNKILYETIDSQEFDRIPLVKINSILSIEEGSNNLFNNFNNDNIYQLNNNIFDLSSKDKIFNSKFYLKKDHLNEYSYINDKTFNIFNKSLYLENNLYNCGKFFISFDETNDTSVGFNDQLKNSIGVYEKTKFANPNENENTDNFFKNQYFNPFLFTSINLKSNIVIEEETGERTSINASGNGQFVQRNSRIDVTQRIENSVLYESDLRFLDHNINENKEILNLTFETNNAKKILSGPKFNFIVYRNNNLDINKKEISDNNTDVGIEKYKVKKIKYISYNKHPSNKNLNNSIYNREIIDNSNINLYTNIFRNYYDLENLDDDSRILNVIQNNENFVDSLQKITKNIIKQDNISLEYTGKIKDLTNQLNNIKSDIELKKGFVLIRSSMNELDINKMKDKFIRLDQNLTKENEFLNDRIITYSQKNKSDDNISYISDELKLQGIKEIKWEKFSFDLRRNIYDLKKKKLNYLNENSFLNYLKTFKNKAKSVNKVLNNDPYVSLLYSNLFKNSLDSLEDSDFIVSQGGENYTKFNFSKEYNNVKNSVESIIDSNENKTFPINSQNIKDFSSRYYTNSQFQTSSSYFNFIMWNMHHKIFNEEESNSSSWSGWSKGYDKLLSDALISSDNPDVGKCLAISAILNYKNLSVSDNFNTINNQTDGIFLSYINEIYSTKNFKKQKSYTLRTIDFPDINITTQLSDNNSEVNPKNISFGSGQAQNFDGLDLPKRIRPLLGNHSFDFGVLPGSCLSFCFPFFTSQYDYKIKEESGYCSAYGFEDESGFYVVDKNNFSSNEDSISVEGLYEYLYSNYYNYDSYLENSSLSLGENLNPGVLYNFDKNKTSIYHIIRQSKSSSLGNINDSTDFKPFIDNITNTFSDIVNEREKVYSDINNQLNYKRWGNDFEDYALGNISFQPRFKNFINNNIIDMLKFLDNDFDNKLDNIEDIEDIVNFVNENSQDIKIITNLLKSSCYIYSSIFDIIIESSIRKNISKILIGDEFNWTYFWDKSVYDLLEINKLNNVNNKEKYEFEKDIESESDMNSTLYTDFHSQVMNINKVLNNSDIMEIMSIDAIMSYFTEFERFNSNSTPFINIKSKLDDLEEIGIRNPNLIIENDMRLNTISKKMNDYFYYQDIEFQKVFQQINSDLNQNLKNHFDNLINNSNNLPGSFFSTIIKKEESKSILSLQGSNLLNILNLRYDIMRFGIDFNLANTLSNNKILKFKIHISNHKYPNLFIPPIYKFYTPMLTSVTPSHLELIQNSNNEDIFIDDFIGIYDISENNIKERYKVYNTNEALNFINDNILKNINSERLFRGEENLISIDGQNDYSNSSKILRDSIISNAIKYTNYRSQKYIDENNITSIDGNISSYNNFIIGYFNSMSQKDFVETFSESYEKSQNIIDSLNENYNKVNVINDESHFVEFFKYISEYINQEKVIESFEFNKYYDIFSIYIGRDDIKNNLKSYYSGRLNSDPGLDRVINSEYFYDSFSYIIEAEIV